MSSPLAAFLQAPSAATLSALPLAPPPPGSAADAAPATLRAAPAALLAFAQAHPLLAPRALQALKIVGTAESVRSVMGSEEILSQLLAYLPQAPAGPASGSAGASGSSSSTSYSGAVSTAFGRAFTKRPGSSRAGSSSGGMRSSSPPTTPLEQHVDEWAAGDAALRVLNNALFLHEPARVTFADVGGAARVTEMLRNTSSTPPEILFLGARLLFFCTLFEAPFNRVGVEEHGLVGVLVALLNHVINTHAAAPAREMGQLLNLAGEALKTAFNLGLYYPRLVHSEVRARDEKAVVGEGWDRALETLIEPTVRLLVAVPLPPGAHLGVPHSNAIAVLLNCPISPYRSWWFTAPRPPDEKPSAARRIATAVFSRNNSNANATSSPVPSSPSSSSSSAPLAGNAAFEAPLLTALLGLLDGALARFFPRMSNAVAAEDDEGAARRLAQSEGSDVEDTLQPLVLLLRKIAVEDADARAALRARILPHDIDRTVPLNKREDLTGRLIRRMASVLLPRLGRVCGELLLAICDSDPKTMSSEIGYGPCAGFLMQANLAHALPTSAAPRTAAAGSGETRAVNPITGQLEPSAADLAAEAKALAAMSEEQKEQEAERLFTLFDRLNKTGVVNVKNPVREARESGRFVEIDEREEERRRKEEDEEEKRLEEEVEREMGQYRARKGRG